VWRITDFPQKSAIRHTQAESFGPARRSAFRHV
jgi:hypothetical protein